MFLKYILNIGGSSQVVWNGEFVDSHLTQPTIKINK